MIRLILSVFFFLISLLAVFKAPVYYLWLLAIAVTEYPWIFMFITLALLAAGFWTQKYQLASTTIGLGALLLFISPIARAHNISATLKQNLAAVFGGDSSKSHNDIVKPFMVVKMFAGEAKG